MYRFSSSAAREGINEMATSCPWNASFSDASVRSDRITRTPEGKGVEGSERVMAETSGLEGWARS